MGGFYHEGVFDHEGFLNKIGQNETFKTIYQDVMSEPPLDYEKPKYLEDCIEKVRQNAEKEMLVFLLQKTLESDHGGFGDEILKNKRERTKIIENEVE